MNVGQLQEPTPTGNTSAPRKARASPPLGKRVWTAEDESYLTENWGRLSIPTIAANLNRTPSAIKIRASRLQLGPVLDSGDCVTLNQFLHAIGCQSSYSYKMQSWVKNRGLPVHTRRVENCSWRVIYIDEFWKWAEQHRAFIDFSKIEPLALGKEPKWVAEQRRNDFASAALQRKDPWSADEDARLKHYLQKHKYGAAELAAIFQRSEGAIFRRCRDLGLKERPVRADTRGDTSIWTPENYRVLADGIREGRSYALIGKEIGKSEKAIRGKAYYEYLTENADKIRVMLGDGEWGNGAPEPTVQQGYNLSRTRKEVRKNLSILDALLRARLNTLGYDPYWQRFMCMNWDIVSGCKAGCDNCDECIEFKRIKPQYCARCGGTFYERQENRFCFACRTARKKQAQKKWAILNARERGRAT